MVLVFIVLSTVRSPIRMFRSFAWPIDIVSLIIFLSLNQIRSSHYVRIRVSRKKAHTLRGSFLLWSKTTSPLALFRFIQNSIDFFFARSFKQWHTLCAVHYYSISFTDQMHSGRGRFLSPSPFLLSIVVLVTCNQARDHTIFLHGRQFIIFNSCYCFHSNRLPAKYAPLVSGKWCKKITITLHTTQAI